MNGIRVHPVDIRAGRNQVRKCSPNDSREKPRLSLAEPRTALRPRREGALGGIRWVTVGGVFAAVKTPIDTFVGCSKIDFPRVDRRFSKALFSEPLFQGVHFCEVREISRGFESHSSAETTILVFLARGLRRACKLWVDFSETLGSRLYKTRGTIHDRASNAIVDDIYREMNNSEQKVLQLFRSNAVQ
jgi:hypothetical protein